MKEPPVLEMLSFRRDKGQTLAPGLLDEHTTALLRDSWNEMAAGAGNCQDEGLVEAVLRRPEQKRIQELGIRT